MHTELAVLRAMLRISRRRATSDLDTLLLRVGGTESELRTALRSLAASGFVERLRSGDCRLTMAGLAVAVAQIPSIKTQVRTRKLTVRRRAA
jgi:hypothetical protein